MFFMDEMNASIKTPQQVMSEKENEELATIRRRVQYDFDAMKSELKKQANMGLYTDYGSHKVISSMIISDIGEYCNIETQKGTEKRGFFGNDIHFYVDLTCTYKVQKYVDYYFKELDKLVSAEGISYTVFAKWEDIAPRKEYHCSVPGKIRIPTFRILHRDVKICMKISMKL